MDCIGDWPDVGTYLTLTKFSRPDLLNLKVKRPELYCNQVKEKWFADWITLYFNSHLSEGVGQTLLRLLSNGIDIKWERNFVVRRSRAITKSIKSKNENDLSFGTPFKFCAILISVAILISGVEKSTNFCSSVVETL